MAVLRKSTDWAHVHASFRDPKSLCQEVKRLDKDNSGHLLPVLKKYVDSPEFSEDAVRSISWPAANLRNWIQTVYDYIHIVEQCKEMGYVAPKTNFS